MVGISFLTKKSNRNRNTRADLEHWKCMQMHTLYIYPFQITYIPKLKLISTKGFFFLTTIFDVMNFFNFFCKYLLLHRHIIRMTKSNDWSPLPGGGGGGGE